MRKINIKIGMLLSLVLSICTSLVGCLFSDYLSGILVLPMLGISFVMSAVISLIIPVGSMTEKLDIKLGFRVSNVDSRLVDSFFIVLIYVSAIICGFSLLGHFVNNVSFFSVFKSMYLMEYTASTVVMVITYPRIKSKFWISEEITE